MAVAPWEWVWAVVPEPGSDMRGELTFSAFSASAPRPAAQTFIERPAAELDKSRPAALVVKPAELTVRGGMFRLVPSWNLLVSVTSATVRVSAAANQVIVQYEVNTTQLLVFCVIASVVFLIASAPRGPIGLVVGGQLVVWIWLFGSSYIMTRMRFVRLLRRVARACGMYAASPSLDVRSTGPRA